MIKVFEYQTHDVCSRVMKISYDNDTIVSVEIVGGCQGNLKGISKLVENRSIDDVIALLDGISCRGSRTGKTSCPDQLSKALRKLKDN